MRYTVTHVRMEWSSYPRTHEHIDGVCTSPGGGHTSRAGVVASIARGDEWFTLAADGTSARIRQAAGCPVAGCTATPYITTAPDHSRTNNLDNLPRC